MNLFELSAKIELDTRAYRSEIKNAQNAQMQFNKTVDAGQKEVDQLSNSLASYSSTANRTAVNTDKNTRSMGNSWDSFGVTALGIIAGVVAALTAGFAKITSVGVSYNSEIESYVTNFRVMLGDAEAATAKVDQLRDMAARTPFGLSDLAAAAQTLLSFDIEAEKTEDILQRIGDVALGNAEKMRSLTLAFSQATSSGKLMGQDLLQMINAGFNPLNQLVDATGLSVGQLKEIMGGASKESLTAMKRMKGVTDYGRQIIEQGYISADDLSYALEIATSEGGQFFNGMAEASKTTSGLFSTLTDDAKDLIGNFFTPMSGFLKSDILPGAIGIISDISGMLDPNSTEAQKSFADRVQSIFAGAGKFIEDNAPGFINTGMTILLAVANGLADNASLIIDPLADALNKGFEALAKNSPKLLTAAGKLIGALLKGTIATNNASASPIAEGLVALVSSLPDLIRTISEQVDWTMALEGMYALPLMTALIGVLPELGMAISEVMPEIIMILGNSIAASAPSLVGVFFSLIETLIKSTIQYSVDRIISDIPFIFSSVVEAIRAVALVAISTVDGIFQSMDYLPESFRGKVSGALDSATSFVSGIDNPFSSVDYTDVVSRGGTGVVAGNTSIGDVNVEVNVPNTNASPEEIGDAVAEAISIALGEVSSRKAAAYGR